MQQPVIPSTLQMQLQSLQMQLQLQSSNGPASQLQPRTSGLGSAPLVTVSPTSSAGLTFGGPSPTHVLLVSGEPTLGAIFRQALSQAPVPSVLHLASTLDFWAVIEQVKRATGRLSGPDIVFFQPEVLMSNPGTVLRLKQVCGSACPAVVLQGSEPIARALQADDFLPGPTPIHPLRKEDLALIILKWRSRQQVSGSSSTVSSALSTGGASVTSGTTAGAGAAPGGFAAGTGAAAAPSGASSSGFSQGSQLQALQAQLQALQQAKLDHKARSSHEIQPAGLAGVGVRASPPRRPPPLRLASAGYPPADAQLERDRALARSSTPASGSAGVPTANGNGTTDVGELVAQVAELRRKLGDKSRTTSMRSPTASGSGGADISPTGSLSGSLVLRGGRTSTGGGAGGASGLGLSQQQQQQQPLPPLPPVELQLQLQRLHQKQQALLQQMEGTGGGASGGAGMAVGGGLQAGGVANRVRRQGTPELRSFGSLARPAGPAVSRAAAAAPVTAAAATPTTTPAAQLASLQLQQQLLQLQQLQLQLQQQQQQQQRLPLAAPAAPVAFPTSPLTKDFMQGGSWLPNTSPTGSLGSPSGSPLPSPGSGGASLQHNASNASSDGGGPSRSNSFVAAGGTRYRPPRPRSPSPLGGASAAASGHLSDTYPGPGTSRFASPHFRSGSGSGAAPGAVGVGVGSSGSRRGAGTGSGHTSDSGAIPDLGPSARDSMRSGSTALAARKSGDDAIAAALSAASGEAEAEADSRGDGGNPNVLADALRNLEAAGDGGSSTDGRSLMDASFALEDSGGGGRGSISGGATSSIDFQPSPVHAGGGDGSAAAAAAGIEKPEAQQRRANLGATSFGSHRVSASTIQTEPDDDPPLEVSAARKPAHAAASPAPAAAKASGQPASGVSREARSAAAAATSAGGSDKAAGAGAAQLPAAATPQKPRVSSPPSSPQKPPASAGGAGKGLAPSDAGSGSRKHGSPAVSDIRPASEDDAVRMASPDSSQHNVQQSQPQPSSEGSRGSGSGTSGGGAAAPAVRPLRSDSRGDDRLPSIDGSQPLIAAGTRSVAAAASSSLRRQASARKALSDDLRSGGSSDAAVAQASSAGRGKAASAGAALGGEASSSSSIQSVAGAAAAVASVEPQFHRARSGGTTDSPAVHRPSDGSSQVASIEGSITAGLPRAASRGATALRGLGATGGPGLAEPRHLLPSSSRERSGAAAPYSGAGIAAAASGGGYSDDIFAALQGQQREVSSPALLQPPQPSPPRSSTPPARRAARILMCSHPIVITREDFMPF